MSKITLAPSPTGSAVYTIASPAGSTDRTLTLPDVAGVMYAQGNIVGTVSQSGGVPTGAIIERGSNANGEFVRYADGTQVATFRAAFNAGSNVQVFRSTWNFPVTFAVIPACSGHARGFQAGVDDAKAFMCADTSGTPNSIATETQMQITVFKAAGAMQQVDISVIAIGRWF